MEVSKSLVLHTILLFFFHVVCESDTQIAPMERTEQEALYSMIQGFAGEWWNGSGLYPDPCGWTPIQGVSCDLFNASWYVTSVSIGPVLENSLVCSHNAKFNPYLFQLKHLKSLTFFNCFSSPTTLPSKDWDSFQRLETLEFRSNQGLVGEIPPIIGQLVNLQSIVFVENSLSGQLPQELGNLVHLKRLTLSGNKFTGQIPMSLGQNLANLLILDLSRNFFSGPLHPSLGGLTSLLKLDTSSNLLNGNLPNELGNMKSLTLLDLRNNNLSGGLNSLQGLVSLQDMLLSNNPMSGNLIEFGWENLVNLTHLDLSNMSLIGEIPKSIEGLSRLRFLSLDNNHLSGSIPPGLGALTSLNALYLNANNFSGEIRFDDDFYKRVGKRFASWGNPDLCCRREANPVGVSKCKNEQGEVSRYDFDSENSVGRGRRDQSSDQSLSGFSASCISRVLFVQQVVVMSVLALLL